jgi:hypothetical protein
VVLAEAPSPLDAHALYDGRLALVVRLVSGLARVSTRRRRRATFVQRDVYQSDVPIGPCCCCEQVGPLPNLMMLSLRGLDSARGKGWGCFQCSLPADGASAAICGRCLPPEWQPGMPRPGGEIRFACTGYVSDPGRVPVVELVEHFDHDLAKHPEVSREGG